MTTKTRIVFSTPLSKAFQQSQTLFNGNRFHDIASLTKLFGAMPGGQFPAMVAVREGAVNATATVTISSTGPTATETMTLANVTLTAVASSTPGNNQFTVSTTPATAAANLAICINASTSLANIVSATANGAVVTVSAFTPGLEGNGLQINVGTLVNTSVTAFANGSDGTSTIINLL